jgi:gluconokinase
MNSVAISNPIADARLIVVMGVAGCGKSSLAAALASQLGFTFFDADDFHSEESRARMASGLPLTDAMRAPWVQSLHDRLKQEARDGNSCTLAFSGLRKAHRDIIRKAGLKTLFLFLDGSKEVISDRLHKRVNHFMDPGLLDSQFDSLEKPQEEPDIIRLDIKPPLESVVNQALTILSELPDW